ncbi:MAG: hypothetical protein ACR2QM_15530 [Longimicrobiales bacterium]
MKSPGHGGRLVGGAAVVVAALTGLTGALLGATGGFMFGAVALVMLSVLALPYPFLITGQLIAGSTLAAAILLSEPAEPISVLPLVAGIVATAELLALAARRRTAQSRGFGDEVRRLAVAILIAEGVFGAVLWLGGLPGPTGLLAIVLASGACVALSFVLIGRSPSGHSLDQTLRP